MVITLNIQRIQYRFNGSSFVPTIEDRVSKLYGEFLNGIYREENRGYLPALVNIDDILKKRDIPYNIVSVEDIEPFDPDLIY